MLCSLCHALGRHDERSLRNEDGYNLNGFLHQSATISSEVKHESLHALILEINKSLSQVLGHISCEAALEDIACGVVNHSRIFYVRKMDALPYDRHVECISGADLLHLEYHLCARLSFHPVAAFLGFQALCRQPVYLQNLVSADKSVLVCGRTEIRLVDHHVLILLLVDDGSDTAVGL